MEIFGLITVMSALNITFASALLSIALPVLWLWMLVDAILREEHEYPHATATSNNRLVWVLVIAFVQVAAVPYFFVVYAKVRRGSLPRSATPSVA